MPKHINYILPFLPIFSHRKTHNLCTLSEESNFNDIFVSKYRISKANARAYKSAAAWWFAAVLFEQSPPSPFYAHPHRIPGGFWGECANVCVCVSSIGDCVVAKLDTNRKREKHKKILRCVLYVYSSMIHNIVLNTANTVRAGKYPKTK